MKGYISEILECNMEIDRMINKGQAGSIIDSRYPVWQLEINGEHKQQPLNKMGCQR